MLNQQTLDKLKELKLHGLAAAWAEQQTLTDYAGLGFDERLGLLVDAEWLTRNNARLKRNVKEAHLGSVYKNPTKGNEKPEIATPGTNAVDRLELGRTIGSWATVDFSDRTRFGPR